MIELVRCDVDEFEHVVHDAARGDLDHRWHLITQRHRIAAGRRRTTRLAIASKLLGR